MDTHRRRSVSHAPGDCPGGSEDPFVRLLFAGYLANESLSARSDKKGMPPGIAQLRQPSCIVKKPQIVLL